MKTDPLATESLSVAFDPTTGIVYAERLGHKVTEEELIRACGYEMDEVEIDPSSIETKAWPTSMKLEKRDEDGKIIQSEPIQVWNHYLRLKFSPRYDEVVSRAVKDELLAEIRHEVREAGRRRPRPARKIPDDARPVLVEIDLFDPHFQMLAWGPETGNHYDLSIAAERYLSVALALASRARQLEDGIERWLLVIGQDLFHTATEHYRTAAGTRQDVDGRTPKAVRIVRRLLTEIILDLLDTAPVDVMVVPGNHGPERDWFMGEIIDARFEGYADVRVDNEPRAHKYYRYGNALLAFAHGKDEGKKRNRLGITMSQEAPEDWAATRFREWHLGHFHHESTVDQEGVVIRYLPALAGTDAWHHQNLYRSQRGARAFVWTRDSGITYIIHENLPVTDEEMEFTAPLLRGDR